MSGKNVIAITIYNKPDLLFIYLSQLEKSGELDRYKLRLHADHGYDREEDVVVEDFKKRNPTLDIKVIVKEKVRCPFPGYYNIISSYPISAEEADEFVIIGEEDMIPTEDYLRFNRICYEQYLSRYDRIFGVCHKRRPEAEKEGDPSLLMGDYQLTSLSCISVKNIKKYITPIVSHPLYYSDPITINYMLFSNLRIHPEHHTHHDGAIERIMLSNDMFAIKPDQARSMHVGLSGVFCQGTPPQGTLEERVAQWYSLIQDGDRLRSLSTMPKDLVVTNLKGPEWGNLELDIDRSRCKASTWFYDVNNDFQKYILSKEKGNRDV